MDLSCGKLRRAQPPLVTRLADRAQHSYPCVCGRLRAEDHENILLPLPLLVSVLPLLLM